MCDLLKETGKTIWGHYFYVEVSYCFICNNWIYTHTVNSQMMILLKEFSQTDYFSM